MVPCCLHDWTFRSSAQLSVSFETVAPSLLHDSPCFFLCEHREKVQQGCTLLFVWNRHHHCWRLSRCLWQSRTSKIDGTRVSVECEIPIVICQVRIDVPLFSRLPRVPTLLRSSQCPMTVNAISIISQYHNARKQINIPIPGILAPLPRKSGKRRKTGAKVRLSRRLCAEKCVNVMSTEKQILCCSLGKFSKILNLTKHGSKD